MSWCSIAMKLWLPEGTYPESFEKKKRTNRFSVRPQLLFGSRITIHHKTGSWAILPGTLWGGKTPRKTRRKTNESIIFDIYIYIYIYLEREIYIYIYSIRHTYMYNVVEFLIFVWKIWNWINWLIIILRKMMKKKPNTWICCYSMYCKMIITSR